MDSPAIETSVHWSQDDRAYVGTCPDYRDRSFIAASEAEAREGIKKLVRQLRQDQRKE